MSATNGASSATFSQRGTVVCSTCSVPLYAPGKAGGFPRGIFHTHDYPFYYFDLRKNAGVRIRAYLRVHGAPKAHRPTRHAHRPGED